MQDFSRAKPKMLVPEAQGQCLYQVGTASVWIRWGRWIYSLVHSPSPTRLHCGPFSSPLPGLSISYNFQTRSLRQTLPVTLEKSYNLEKEGGLGGGVYWPFTSLTGFSTELSPRRRLLSLGLCHHGLHFHGTQSLSHLWERRHTGETHSEWVAVATGLLLLKQNPFPISASLILSVGIGSPRLLHCHAICSIHSHTETKRYNSAFPCLPPSRHFLDFSDFSKYQWHLLR